jgi:RNA polymerase sigma-70 factor (ECF subfamily)
LSESRQLLAHRGVVPDDEDDAAVVVRCLEGDVQAFAVLVERYQRVLYNLGRRMLGNPEDARDASQTAFLKAWDKLSSFDPRFRFFSWIYRITVNECLNQIDRRRRVEPLDPEINLPSSEDAGSGLRAREASEKIQAALLRLTPKHREVVILRHFLEMSYGEIAGTLTLPEKTVKSRLYEARQRLCELLPASAA